MEDGTHRGTRAQARKSRNTALGYGQCLKPSIPRHGRGFPKAEQKECSAPGMPTALATYCRVTSQHRHGSLRWVNPLPCARAPWATNRVMTGREHQLKTSRRRIQAQALSREGNTPEHARHKVRIMRASLGPVCQANLMGIPQAVGMGGPSSTQADAGHFTGCHPCWMPGRLGPPGPQDKHTNHPCLHPGLCS